MTDRLSRENFGGDLTRALLYKAMRNPKEDWPIWEVQPNEEYDLYKISNRIYGTPDLWWAISICTKLDDPMGKLTAGTTFQYPPITWIRSKLKNPGKTVTD